MVEAAFADAIFIGAIGAALKGKGDRGCSGGHKGTLVPIGTVAITQSSLGFRFLEASRWYGARSE
jgi:hypothetical protein